MLKDVYKMHLLHHLVHVKSQDWIFFTRDNDNRVGSCDGGPKERHEAEERLVVRTSDANNSDWFMNLNHRA